MDPSEATVIQDFLEFLEVNYLFIAYFQHFNNLGAS